MNDFRAEIRTATRGWHDRVDEGFGRFRLNDRENYSAFLTAHARALMPLEDWIGAHAPICGWVGRSAALTADLEALELPVPSPLHFETPTSEAARWGALYVVEGSRLGAAMLARNVPERFPSAYLDARHRPGEWRSLIADMEARAAEGGEDWQAAACDGAVRAFALFDRAAREACPEFN